MIFKVPVTPQSHESLILVHMQKLFFPAPCEISLSEIIQRSWPGGWECPVLMGPGCLTKRIYPLVAMAAILTFCDMESLHVSCCACLKFVQWGRFEYSVYLGTSAMPRVEAALRSEIVFV